MNSFKKIFCRVFQKVMHLLIPIFPYREPTLLNGFNEIIGVLNKSNINNVMLVTDKGIRGLGLTLAVEKLLEENNIKCTVYDGTLPNPTSNNIEEARTLYLENNCNALIAFGGGSAMDCAKALGARIVRPKMSLNKMSGLIKIRKKLFSIHNHASYKNNPKRTAAAMAINILAAKLKFSRTAFPFF